MKVQEVWREEETFSRTSRTNFTCSNLHIIVYDVSIKTVINEKTLEGEQKLDSEIDKKISSQSKLRNSYN